MSTEATPPPYRGRLRVARTLAPAVVLAVAVITALAVLHMWPGTVRESLTAPPAPYTQVLSTGYSFSFGRGVYDVVIEPHGTKLNATLTCLYCISGRNASIKKLTNVDEVTEVSMRCRYGLALSINALVPPFHEHVADVVVRRATP